MHDDKSAAVANEQPDGQFACVAMWRCAENKTKF